MIKQLIIYGNLLSASNTFYDIYYWPVPKLCSIAIGGLNVFLIFLQNDRMLCQVSHVTLGLLPVSTVVLLRYDH